MATVSIKCPNCGGGLQFDPAGQDYECEYCLSRFTPEELERQNQMERMPRPAKRHSSRSLSRKMESRQIQSRPRFTPAPAVGRRSLRMTLRRPPFASTAIIR